MCMSESCVDAIRVELESFIQGVVEKYRKRQLNHEMYNEILFFCVDLMGCSICEKYNNEIEEIILFILSELKKDIYEKKFKYLKPGGMLKGVGLLAFSMRILLEKGKNVSGFLEYYNKILFENTKKILEIVKEVPLYFSHYDLTSGIAGILNYLLYDTDKTDITLVRGGIEFLINLTCTKKYKGDLVPGFHIEREQQYLDIEKEIMCNGNLNFGLAHGMIGVLVVLVKYKSMGYSTDGLDDAINSLFDIYKRFTIRDEGTLKFPTQLAIESYINCKNEEWSFNSGWCYGNSGIAAGLMRSEAYMKRQKEYCNYEEALINIINQPIEKYNLWMPIVCHGYGSIIAVQTGAYLESGNQRFLKTIERNVWELLKAHQNYQKVNEQYINNFSIVQGAGGVILTLVDAVTYSLDYKRLLMLCDCCQVKKSK